MKLYYPVINLLRALAALMVGVYHFTNYSDINGDLLSTDDTIRGIGELGLNGVYIFFVISGLVIPISLFKGKYSLRSLHRFITRRWIRIEIPYIFSMIAVLLVTFMFSLRFDLEFAIDAQQFIHHLLYTIPFTDYEWYNVIYWTLAIEFQFYLLIALIYPLLSSKNSWISNITLILFIVSGIYLDDNKLIFHYAPLFALGIVLFLKRIGRINSNLMMFYVLICLAIISWQHNWIIMLFCLFTVFVIYFVNLDNKLANKSGDVSYSFYLIHGLVGGNLLYIFNDNVDSYLGKLGLIVLALSFSIVVSYIFWRLIEAPSKKLSKRVKM